MSSAHQPDRSADTEPGALDYSHGYKRRMSDHKLQALADSAFLKVAQYAVTGIAIPLIGWGLSAVLDRLNSIDRSVNQFTTQAATTELRLQQVERAQSEHGTAIRSLQDDSKQHGYEIRRLEERTTGGGAFKR